MDSSSSSRSPKRPADFGNDGASKRAKVAGGPKMSVAERMMARMGYKKGEGLGKDASGIATPIEVKLRPQGVGVGAVKEKTAQAKAEARRQAERRGETYQDSSDEEREARRLRKEAAKKSRASGFGPPGSVSAAAARPKQKFRTAAEIEAEEGLEVPSVFKSLVDMTGAQPKLLTSTAGLLSVQPLIPAGEAESAKLAKSAQRELEAFADAWHELQQRRKYLVLQQQQARADIKRRAGRLTDAQNLCAAVDGVGLEVQSLSLSLDAEDLKTCTLAAADKLESLSADFPGRTDLDQVAVSALAPAFKSFMTGWDPFDADHNYNPSFFPAVFSKLAGILNLADSHAAESESEILDSEDSPGERIPTPFENLILAHWLPRVRAAVVNEWSPFRPDPMLALVHEWRPVLPLSVTNVVLNQYVVQKLAGALNSWKPVALGKAAQGKAAQGKETTASQLHTWLFPWLSHLDEYHLDAKSSAGLLAEVKRKFRAAFATWDIAKGVFPGLDRWLEVPGLRPEMQRDLELKMLPRLARHLHAKLNLDPSDQDMAPLQDVLSWLPLFRPDKFSRVLLDAFFPKWLSTLHLWLTSDPNYEEVGQWFSWWQNDVFPSAITALPEVAAEWDAGLSLMNLALDMDPVAVKSGLPVPSTRFSQRRADKKHSDDGRSRPGPAVEQTTPAARVDDAATFKDIVDDLCEQQDLLIMPLRKAHPETGLPLFRITASAAGVGGVQAYIKGDVLWAQNKKDRSVWEPVDVFEPGTLVALAEGK